VVFAIRIRRHEAGVAVVTGERTLTPTGTPSPTWSGTVRREYLLASQEESRQEEGVLRSTAYKGIKKADAF
jgi:hypothetical protein